MNRFDKTHYVFPTFDPIKKLELFKYASRLEIYDLTQYAHMNNIPINVSNDIGDNLIHEVLKISDTKISEYSKLNAIKTLVSNNVNPDSSNKENITPLHMACYNQYKDIVNYLLELKVNVNATDNMNATPLHYLMKGNMKIFEVKEIKPFIQYTKSPSIKIDQKINELKSEIINQIQKNDTQYKILDILKETIFNVLLEDPKISDYANHLKNVIVNKGLTELTNSSSQETAVLYYKEFIKNRINNILGITKIPIEIHKKEMTSWGPTDTPDYGLIKNGDGKKYIKSLFTLALKNITKLRESFKMIEDPYLQELKNKYFIKILKYSLLKYSSETTYTKHSNKTIDRIVPNDDKLIQIINDIDNDIKFPNFINYNNYKLSFHDYLPIIDIKNMTYIGSGLKPTVVPNDILLKSFNINNMMDDEYIINNKIIDIKFKLENNYIFNQDNIDNYLYNYIYKVIAVENNDLNNIISFIDTNITNYINNKKITNMQEIFNSHISIRLLYLYYIIKIDMFNDSEAPEASEADLKIYLPIYLLILVSALIHVNEYDNHISNCIKNIEKQFSYNGDIKEYLESLGLNNIDYKNKKLIYQDILNKYLEMDDDNKPLKQHIIYLSYFLYQHNDLSLFENFSNYNNFITNINDNHYIKTHTGIINETDINDSNDYNTNHIIIAYILGLYYVGSIPNIKYDDTDYGSIILNHNKKDITYSIEYHIETYKEKTSQSNPRIMERKKIAVYKNNIESVIEMPIKVWEKPISDDNLDDLKNDIYYTLYNIFPSKQYKLNENYNVSIPNFYFYFYMLLTNIYNNQINIYNNIKEIEDIIYRVFNINSQELKKIYTDKYYYILILCKTLDTHINLLKQFYDMYYDYDDLFNQRDIDIFKKHKYNISNFNYIELAKYLNKINSYYYIYIYIYHPEKKIPYFNYYQLPIDNRPNKYKYFSAELESKTDADEAETDSDEAETDSDEAETDSDEAETYSDEAKAVVELAARSKASPPAQTRSKALIEERAKTLKIQLKKYATHLRKEAIKLQSMSSAAEQLESIAMTELTSAIETTNTLYQILLEKYNMATVAQSSYNTAVAAVADTAVADTSEAALTAVQTAYTAAQAAYTAAQAAYTAAQATYTAALNKSRATITEAALAAKKVATVVAAKTEAASVAADATNASTLASAASTVADVEILYTHLQQIAIKSYAIIKKELLIPLQEQSIQLQLQSTHLQDDVQQLREVANQQREAANQLQGKEQQLREKAQQLREKAEATDAAAAAEAEATDAPAAAEAEAAEAAAEAEAAEAEAAAAEAEEAAEAAEAAAAAAAAAEAAAQEREAVAAAREQEAAKAAEAAEAAEAKYVAETNALEELGVEEALETVLKALEAVVSDRLVIYRGNINTITSNYDTILYEYYQGKIPFFEMEFETFKLNKDDKSIIVPPSLYNSIKIFYEIVIKEIIKTYCDKIKYDKIKPTLSEIKNKFNLARDVIIDKAIICSIIQNAVFEIIQNYIESSINYYYETVIINNTANMKDYIKKYIKEFVNVNNLQVSLDDTLTEITEYYRIKLVETNVKVFNKHILYSDDLYNLSRFKTGFYVDINQEIINKILSHDGIITTQDIEGRTPIDYLIKQNNFSFLLILKSLNIKLETYKQKIKNKLSLHISKIIPKKEIEPIKDIEEYQRSEGIIIIDYIKSKIKKSNLTPYYQKEFKLDKILGKFSCHLYHDIKSLITANEAFGNNILKYLEDSFKICEYLTFKLLSNDNPIIEKIAFNLYYYNKLYHIETEFSNEYDKQCKITPYSISYDNISKNLNSIYSFNEYFKQKNNTDNKLLNHLVQQNNMLLNSIDIDIDIADIISNYKKIVENLESYFTLHKYTNKNTLLQIIYYNILIYLTRLIIGTNLELIIRRVLYKYFKESSIDKKNIIPSIEIMLNKKLYGYDKSLSDMIYQEICKTMVKNALEIFEDYVDEQENVYTTARELLLNFFDLFNLTIIKIPDNIITIMKRQIIDYFDTFSYRCITYWLVTIENIFKYIINNYRLLIMYQLTD